MIRCSSCKMLNRLGSIHCGFCGHLLTDKTSAGAADAGFKVPRLKSDDSGEHALGLPEAPPGALRQTMLGLPAEELFERAPVSARTIVGMPAVQVEPAGNLPPGVAEAQAAALRRRDAAAMAAPRVAPPPLPAPPAPPTPPAARVVVAGEAADALADTPPPEDLEPIAPARNRLPSQTLFGMRAAELHLGLGAADTTDPPLADLLSDDLSLDVDDDDLGFLDESDDDDDTLDTGGARAFVRKSSSARIEAVAPLRGEGAAFADTAVIKAVDPDAPDMREAIAKAQIAYAKTHGTAPPGAVAATARPALEVPTPPATPSMLGLAPTPRLTEPSAARPTRAPTTASSTPEARLRKWRGLGAGLILVATFLPLSASTWSRVDLWADLGPVLLGVVGLTLVAQPATPRWVLATLGALALALGVFQFTSTGLPDSASGAQGVVRFGLVVVGAILLGVTSLGAVARPPSRPDQPPPRAPG